MLQHLWKSVLLSGVLAVALGVMVLVWPAISIFVAAIFFAAYLLVAGITQVVFAFSLKVSVGGRVLLFVSGAAALVLAVMCFINFGDAVVLLAIWIGIGFIFRGVATMVSAISDPTLPGRWWELFVGVISLIAGVVVLAVPLESLAVLTLVVGICLVVLGVFEIVSAFGIRSASKKMTEFRQEVTASTPE